ncbi:MAG: aldo/keto reductase [Bacteroidota bacterium]
MAGKIILGTVQFGLDYGINNQSGKPDENTVTAILDLAFENNIQLLDTAEAYGDSQEVIGNYHRRSSNRFKVISKYGSGRKDLSQDLHQRILQNLKTLGVDNLHGYMFHSFNDFETYFPVYHEEIKALKNAGLIHNFGVSIYTNTEFEKLLQHNGIDFVQLPFNLLDNNFQRAALIQKANEKGIAVHTRSVFLQGLFFKNGNNLPAKLQALQPYLDEIKQLSITHHLNVNDVALNYAMQQKNISNVLIGVDTVDQLRKNISSLTHTISKALLEQIDALQVKETELLNPSNWN